MFLTTFIELLLSYLGLKIYEERNETFNKRLNPDAD